MSNVVTVSPQPGAQEQFLACEADIAIFGGAAGGGKSYMILLDPLRWTHLDEFHAVIFRRKSTEIRISGGLLSESSNLYPNHGGKLNDQQLLWKFKKNVDIKLAGLPYESDVTDWHGGQLDFIGFDELTTFEESQFWYLSSRLRSTSGNIRPYLRATCNPAPNWVLNLVDWWIGKDGFPIPARAGVVRWFIRINEQLVWFDERQSGVNYVLTHCDDKTITPKSFTFIPANVDDNPINLRKNPDYISTLHSLKGVERDRLLYGNWRVQESGKIFKLEWFQFYNISPPFDLKILTIDTAQQIKSANDFTVVQCWGRSKKRAFLINQFRGKIEYNEQVNVVVNMAINNKVNEILIELASNGAALIQSIRREFSRIGYPVRIREITRQKDKYMRGLECAGYVEHGFVYINKFAEYYSDLIAEVAQFSPENKNRAKVHDDQVDCLIDAVHRLLHQPADSDTVANQKNKSLDYAKLQGGNAITFKGY